MNRHSLVTTAIKSPLFKSIGRRSLVRILEHFHLHRLDKGEYLFRADERSRWMYFVVEGKLRLEKLIPTAGRSQLTKIATLAAGDIVGEVSLLTGERHMGQVRAMTDATLAGVGKKELAPLLRHHPRLLQNLTRIEAMRLRQNVVRDERNLGELGFILHLYFTTASDYAAWQPSIAAALAAERLPSLKILEQEFLKDRSAEILRARISARLLKSPTVYLSVNVARHKETSVTQLVQLADRLVVTVSEDAASVSAANELLAAPAMHNRAARLNPYVMTIHHREGGHLIVSEIQKRLRMGIRQRLRLPKNFWTDGDDRSVKLQSRTVARTITETTQGIAFGGGGARALSEIGIVSELERHRIDFDHVAGTSMGALIAALYAQGLSSRDMSERFRELLPSDKGLLRYNLPFISFFRDRSVNKILRGLFGNARIESLPKPLTIIAADLISGQEIRIRSGLVWRAVRASMSLPVIFPPVKYHGYYLVDGGAINNVPGSALRESGVTRVLGVNCTPFQDDAISEYLASTNLFQLLKPGEKFWRNLKRLFKLIRIFFTRPPILQIANRAMMLEGSELVKQKSRDFDLLLSPDVARFGLFDFSSREEIIDAGRAYARAHAGDLKKLFRRS